MDRIILLKSFHSGVRNRSRLMLDALAMLIMAPNFGIEFLGFGAAKNITITFIKNHPIHSRCLN